MAYSELIKNFDRIRDYMRQFYVYGFKSRTEYGCRGRTRTYGLRVMRAFLMLKMFVFPVNIVINSKYWRQNVGKLKLWGLSLK